MTKPNLEASVLAPLIDAVAASMSADLVKREKEIDRVLNPTKRVAKILDRWTSVYTEKTGEKPTNLARVALSSQLLASATAMALGHIAARCEDLPDIVTPDDIRKAMPFMLASYTNTMSLDVPDDHLMKGLKFTVAITLCD